MQKKPNPLPSQNEAILEFTNNKFSLRLNSQYFEIDKNLDSLRELLLRNGQNTFQLADKIYNIHNIETANFLFFINQFPKNLTEPPPNPELFLGRDQDLTTIKGLLDSSSTNLLLINGVGGIGKTTLASKFYHQYKDQYTHSAWLSNDGNIRDTLLQLAGALKIDFDQKRPIAEYLKVLLMKIAELESHVLLVIDHVNDYEDLNANYQDLRRLSNCRILITSRIPKFEQVNSYGIECLPLEVGKDLFKRYFLKVEAADDELISQLFEEIEGNTLILELLAKNLKMINEVRANYSLAELIFDLKSKGLLEIDSRRIRTDYWPKGGSVGAKLENIISAVYDLSSLKASEKSALLPFIMFPIKGIQVKNIFLLIEQIQQDENVLITLNRKGWLHTESSNQEMYKIHPIIASVLSKEKVPFPAVLFILRTIIGELKRSIEYRSDSISDSPNLLACGVSILGYLDRYSFFYEHSHEIVKASSIMAIYLAKISHSEFNLYYLKSILYNKFINVQNIDDLALTAKGLSIFGLISLIYQQDKSIELFQNSIYILHELTESDKQRDHVTLIRENHANLAAAYFYNKRLSEANQLLEQLIKEEKASKNVSNTFYSLLLNMGAVCYGLGELDKAIQYFKEAKKNATKLTDNNSLIEIDMNIGCVYRDKGAYGLAKSYLEDAQQAYEKTDGPKNSYLESTINENLAILYIETYKTHKKLTKAIHLLQVAIQINSKIDLTNKIIDNRILLCQAYHLHGDNAAAKDQIEQALNLVTQSKSQENGMQEMTERIESARFLLQ